MHGLVNLFVKAPRGRRDPHDLLSGRSPSAGPTMRVAAVIEQLDPDKGGAETYSAGLIGWLLREGHPVTVVAVRWSPALAEEWGEMGGVQWERVDPGTGHRAARARRFAERAGARIAALREAGKVEVALDMGCGLACDVIQPHSGVRQEAVLGTLDSIEGGGRRALRRLLLALDPGERLRRRLQRRRFLAPEAPEVIAMSRLVADCVRRAYGVPESRLHVIHNGVDTARFAPARLAPLRPAAREALGARGEVVCLTVAHNYRLKGAATVLALAERARAQGRPWQFVLAGGSPRQRRPYERSARRRGLGNVRFLGPTREIERWYAAADLFLLPTFYDSCALTTLEALACGLPVLTTRSNGAAELLEDGTHGHVIDHARNLPAFEAALLALQDADRRREMGTAARRRACELDCETNYRRVLEVLRARAACRTEPVRTLAVPVP